MWFLQIINIIWANGVIIVLPQIRADKNKSAEH